MIKNIWFCYLVVLQNFWLNWSCFHATGLTPAKLEYKQWDKEKITHTYQNHWLSRVSKHKIYGFLFLLQTNAITLVKYFVVLTLETRLNAFIFFYRNVFYNCKWQAINFIQKKQKKWNVNVFSFENFYFILYLSYHSSYFHLLIAAIADGA